MKIVTAQDGSRKLVLSKQEWLGIGKRAGWGSTLTPGTSTESIEMQLESVLAELTRMPDVAVEAIRHVQAAITALKGGEEEDGGYSGYDEERGEFDGERRQQELRGPYAG